MNEWMNDTSSLNLRKEVKSKFGHHIDSKWIPIIISASRFSKIAWRQALSIQNSYWATVKCRSLVRPQPLAILENHVTRVLNQVSRLKRTIFWVSSPENNELAGWLTSRKQKGQRNHAQTEQRATDNVKTMDYRDKRYTNTINHKSKPWY